ncbi:PREDICTED: neuronal acetylcholine receptor subunit alpha-10-like isoform X2 [Acropora digitifera]|uniref:neuronal acetylcholine receptor subunit alpha-10-like isoform X2 n=1 Tax=Acropora digitifera TaxID=70779 RepID=UPI00077AAD22|nr:PREDICTED: neuronal acetylcholine receptor subunit alpha-10-like isoform X2 [Acropora digitifera]
MLLLRIKLCIIFLHFLSVSKAEDADETRLKNFVFSKYDAEVRPVLAKNGTVRVEFGISLHQIIEVDFRNQIVKSSVWFRQAWYNPFLRWNSSQFGGINALNVDPSKVWKPDLFLYNNVDDSDDGALDRFKTKIVVRSDGRVKWMAPKIVSSSCKFDVTYFPFDKQHCELKFGSWTYDGFHLDLVEEAAEADLEKFAKNGEWELIGVPCERNLLKYICCDAPYPDITYTVKIRRRTLFFFFNMIIPCLVIVGLTILSFYLPPDSGERLSLVITNLLAMTVFMLLVAEIIPPTSDAVSIISTFYSCCLFEVGVALIGTCVVLKYHFNNPAIHKMPDWLRFIVLRCLGKIFHKKLRNYENLLETSSSFERRRLSTLRTDNGYIDTITARRFSGTISGKWPPDSRSRGMTDERDPNGEPFLDPGPSQLELDGKNSLTKAITQKQGTIANALEKLVEAKEAEDEEGKQREEWMMAASIMDSLFMWIFFFTLVGSLVALFFQLPKYD